MMHEFQVVWEHKDLMLSGLQMTVVLTLISGVASLVLGLAISTMMVKRDTRLAMCLRLLIDLLRCTPFLLAAYFIYYGLPVAGIVLTSWSAGLLTLIVYHSAYMAEIWAAAWTALPKESIDAGHAFGYSGLSLFRRIVLPSLVLNSAGVLGNQVIQIIKDSAFLTVISIAELTHAASQIQSEYFVPFAAFLVAMLLYWALCLLIELGVSAIGRMADARR